MIWAISFIDALAKLFYTLIVDPIHCYFSITSFITCFTFLASPSIILQHAVSTLPRLHTSKTIRKSSNLRIRRLLVLLRCCQRCHVSSSSSSSSSSSRSINRPSNHIPRKAKLAKSSKSTCISLQHRQNRLRRLKKRISGRSKEGIWLSRERDILMEALEN